MGLIISEPTYTGIHLSDINADFLKRNYLHGINTMDTTGEEIADETYNFYLRSATAQLEQMLDLDILPRKRVDRLPYDRAQLGNWGGMKIGHRPIRSIQSSKIILVQNTVYDVPVQWLRFDAERGTILLIPSAFGNLPFLATGQLMMPYLLGMNWFPQTWDICYETGFGVIPANIADVLCMKAALQIFNVLGDIVMGPGVASLSMSLDGYSQSVATTASAENTAYGARITDYEKRLKIMEKELREYWKGIEVFTT